MSLFTIRGAFVSSSDQVSRPNGVTCSRLEFALEGDKREILADVFVGSSVVKLLQPGVIGDFFFDRGVRLQLYGIESADGQSAYDRIERVPRPRRPASYR